MKYIGVMNLEAVVITELSAEKSELVGPLLYISLWHIQRNPRTVKIRPYSLFYVAVQTYQMICRAGCPPPAAEKPC